MRTFRNNGLKTMGKRHENRGVSQDTPLTFCGDSPLRAGLYIGEPHFLAGYVHRWRNTLSREAVCNCPPFTGHSASEDSPFLPKCRAERKYKFRDQFARSPFFKRRARCSCCLAKRINRNPPAGGSSCYFACGSRLHFLRGAGAGKLARLRLKGLYFFTA